MKRKSYLVLGTPRELEKRQEPSINKLDFLLINVSGACNHRCIFCWTHNNTYPIKNKPLLSDEELTSLSKRRRYRQKNKKVGKKSNYPKLSLTTQYLLTSSSFL